MLQISSGIALLWLAGFVADFLMLHVLLATLSRLRCTGETYVVNLPTFSAHVTTASIAAGALLPLPPPLLPQLCPLWTEASRKL